jgi:hypothetical protein
VAFPPVIQSSSLLMGETKSENSEGTCQGPQAERVWSVQEDFQKRRGQLGEFK